ncbi:MAG: acetate kinase, partial [Phenylobacterium sp.]|nr:acetate kinase [Phenylobacterium sp.]
APIRARIAELCGWLGVRLDPEANSAGARLISRAESPIKVLVIPTDEEGVIARGVAGLMSART